MNPSINATSARDLKDAARAIQFVLKNSIKGKEAVAALCDLLEVTAKIVRASNGIAAKHEPRRLKNLDERLVDDGYCGPVTLHGYKQRRKGMPAYDWSRRFPSVEAADAYLGDNKSINVEFVTTECEDC